MDTLYHDIAQYLTKYIIHGCAQSGSKLMCVNKYWCELVSPLLRAYIRSNFIWVTNRFTIPNVPGDMRYKYAKHKISIQEICTIMVAVCINARDSDMFRHKFLKIKIYKEVSFDAYRSGIGFTVYSQIWIRIFENITFPIRYSRNRQIYTISMSQYADDQYMIRKALIMKKFLESYLPELYDIIEFKI